VRYRIELRPAAVRDLAALPRQILRQIDAKILALARDPKPPGYKKLEGVEKFYRIRSGGYRIFYQVHDEVFLVLVPRVKHRRDAQDSE